MTKPTFELYLRHGRDVADRELDNWGPDGPRLKCVIGIHESYRDGANVFFTDAAAAEVARQQTGWEKFAGTGLTMAWEEDLVAIDATAAARHVFNEGEQPQPVRLFSDWGLYLPDKA